MGRLDRLRRGRRGLVGEGVIPGVTMELSNLGHPVSFGHLGVGEGVLAGVGAGGARVEAADFALREGVEQLLAGFVERLQLQDFAAEIAEVFEPGAEVEREGGVEFLAKALGECGGSSRG